MNTVGKPGKLGEQVRCVVIVSMLTEGWDANTVTHILGVRAFGTQLLCEQVVGRGLRRALLRRRTRTGVFEPEYAEVYGVPFSFIPSGGHGPEPQPPKPVHRGPCAVEDRERPARSTFPRLDGYRWEIPDEQLEADFTTQSVLAHRPRTVPTRTELDPIVGESEDARSTTSTRLRAQQVAFALAKRIARPLLPRRRTTRSALALPAARRDRRRWIDECVDRSRTMPSSDAAAQPSTADAAAEASTCDRAGTSGDEALRPDAAPLRPGRLDRRRRLRHHQGPCTTTHPDAATSATSC